MPEPRTEVVECDVLIIGGGMAGCGAAYEAAHWAKLKGLRVVMVEKAVIFQNLTPLIRPGGILFGSTLLGGGIQRGWASRELMTYYNHRRIFSNREDHLDQLDAALSEHFESHVLEAVGSAALFAARVASK